ncbi:MAG: hypothetical protein JSR48_01215 [Verrucomicrobia bacterium]|nr:hypothetical protein [Verrucomicrobiota bacterium]
MRKTLLCLAAAAAVVSLRASAPHPSVLTVKFHDQMLPVAKMIGTDPVVIVDDAEKRIRTAPIYLVQRTDHFAPGFVTARHVQFGGTELKVVTTQDQAQSDHSATPTGPRFGVSYFEGHFTAKQTITGGFIVIVVYSPTAMEGGPSEENQTQVIVHDLPDLPAGQDTAVKVSAALPDGQPNQTYFFQIFDGNGGEVVTNLSELAWKYYALRDRVKLAGIRAQYLEKFHGANHAAVPAVMSRPVFSEGAKPPHGEATAVLAVSPDGLVTHVDIRGVEDAAARADIANALGGWLFLPQLKGGVPVGTKIQVPLEF